MSWTGWVVVIVIGVLLIATLWRLILICAYTLGVIVLFLWALFATGMGQWTVQLATFGGMFAMLLLPLLFMPREDQGDGRWTVADINIILSILFPAAVVAVLVALIWSLVAMHWLTLITLIAASWGIGTCIEKKIIDVPNPPSDEGWGYSSSDRSSDESYSSFDNSSDDISSPRVERSSFSPHPQRYRNTAIFDSDPRESIRIDGQPWDIINEMSDGSLRVRDSHGNEKIVDGDSVRDPTFWD